MAILRSRRSWAEFLGLLALLYLGGCMLVDALVQSERPFAFSHRLHAEDQGLECADCHARSDDVGEFNRDWERYYATATVNDLSTKGLALSLTVDRWDDDDRDTSSFGADLSYEAEKRWRAAIGSYYSLYKYEFLEFDERDDVRTYYVRAGYDVSADVDLDLLYEFEDDDQDTYNTLRVWTVWRF